MSLSNNIDLSDNTLKRDGIKQIYKDEDNEELKYSLRSIFEYNYINKQYLNISKINITLKE